MRIHVNHYRLRITLCTWTPCRSIHTCRDVIAHCNISFEIPRKHAWIRRFRYFVYHASDAGPKEAVLYGKIGREGGRSAPETRQGTRNLKISLSATRRFHTDSHQVQRSMEQLLTLHRCLRQFSGIHFQAGSLLVSRTPPYPPVSLTLQYQTISFRATSKPRYTRLANTNDLQTPNSSIQGITNEMLRRVMILLPSRLQDCTEQHSGHVQSVIFRQ
jgi:hypothetical protein